MTDRPVPTPTTAVPSTAVAVPTREQLSAEVRRNPPGQMSQHARDMLAARKERNATVMAVKASTWAKESLSHEAAGAVVNWAYSRGVDPMTELDILGGKVYVNAQFAIRRLSELTHAGRIARFDVRWIHHDPRLVEIAANGEPEDAAWAREELRARNRLRIDRNVDDTVTSAAMCSIWPVGATDPAIGVKTHTQGRKVTRNKREGGTYTKDADPVGDQFPMETIETRAIRRAMRLLAHDIPDLAVLTSKLDEQGQDVNALLARDRTSVRASATAFPLDKQIATPAASEYGGEPMPPVRRVTTGAPASERLADVPDAEPGDPQPEEEDDSTARDPHDAFALRAMTDAELRALLISARRVQHDELRRRVEDVLEERRLGDDDETPDA